MAPREQALLDEALARIAHRVNACGGIPEDYGHEHEAFVSDVCEEMTPLHFRGKRYYDAQEWLKETIWNML